MSVWRRFEGHGYPSLITTNVDCRRPIFREPKAAQQLIQVIREIEQEEPVDVHAFVVMPDHLHMVISVRPPATFGRIMNLIKGRFARRYNQDRCLSGAVWQSRYHESACLSEEEFVTKCVYVLYNPVNAVLVQEPEDYPWTYVASA